MDFAPEHLARHDTADQRCRNVVKEARQHGHDDEQGESTFLVIRQKGGHDIG
jgi:hypothetical protein